MAHVKTLLLIQVYLGSYRLNGRVYGCKDEEEDQVDNDPVGEASQVKEEGDEGHDEDHQRLDERGHDVETHLRSKGR